MRAISQENLDSRKASSLNGCNLLCRLDEKVKVQMRSLTGVIAVCN